MNHSRMMCHGYVPCVGLVLIYGLYFLGCHGAKEVADMGGKYLYFLLTVSMPQFASIAEITPETTPETGIKGSYTITSFSLGSDHVPIPHTGSECRVR